MEVLIPSIWRRSKNKKHLEITVSDKSDGAANSKSTIRKYDISDSGTIAPAAGNPWLTELPAARRIYDSQRRSYLVIRTYQQWNLALERFVPTYLFIGPFDVKKPFEIVAKIEELSDKIYQRAGSKNETFDIVVNSFGSEKAFRTTPYSYTVLAVPNSERRVLVNKLKTAGSMSLPTQRSRTNFRWAGR